jgi:hypothetical protein
VKIFSLDDFVRESNRIEGIHREPTGEEVAATARFLSRTGRPITVSDLINLVAVYQPNAKPRFIQGLDVRVGDHIAPRGGPQVQAALASMLENKDKVRDAYEMHVEYEILHPFTDGNGRSGRALWLREMGGMWKAPLGFLHHFYYQTLARASTEAKKS